MARLIPAVVLSAAIVSWAVCLVVRHVAARYGFVDRPGERKIHARPIPTGGGLGIWAGVVLPLAAAQLVLFLCRSDWIAPHTIPLVGEFLSRHAAGLWVQSIRLWTLLGLGTVLLILGLLDDRYSLDWRLRLGVEVLVALATYAAGWRLTVFVQSQWLSLPLTVLWIVGLINSFNMLDNMDGLSAGVAAIAAGLFGIVMATVPDSMSGEGQLFVAAFSFLFLGTLTGFLWHNRPPARLFMGDGGSYFVGFIMAAVTLTATFAGDQVPRHAIIAPLCVLAVPIYDTATVVAIRIRAGKSPFEGDKNHFSHRLVELGMTTTQAVLTVYLTTTACGLGALLLYQVDLIGAFVVVAMVGCMLSVIAVLEATARRSRRRDGDKSSSMIPNERHDA
ncbi:MAG: undecaprenyl/decaprenyl-phosphate alpha-N-acetylglucosaminyl 1-phosphate transferase [Planctomycetota bacterium]|nr:MAG: undecaprenyl/decaprenyl-phosphate alpha-N-acetylglucosaminyl 1-phosphate transferase [Planctomycetota bacterium]